MGRSEGMTKRKEKKMEGDGNKEIEEGIDGMSKKVSELKEKKGRVKNDSKMIKG